VAKASVDMLKKVPLFAGLDDRELDQIASSSRAPSAPASSSSSRARPM